MTEQKQPTTEQKQKPDAAAAARFFQDKLSFTTGPIEVNAMIQEGKDVVIADVRAADDFAEGHVPGAISLPEEKWENPEGLSKDKTTILYCYSHVCHLGARAAVALAEQGYPVMEMDGGMAEWKANHLPEEMPIENGRGDRAPALQAS